MRDPSFAPIELLALASEILLRNGYVRVVANEDWSTDFTRLFEDPYSVVGLAAFESCDDLLSKWTDLQGSLVDALSKHVTRADPKAWDGYLVLMTPSAAPSRTEALDDLRYNTNRVRKIVATGDEVRTVVDLSLMLSPLLPLTIANDNFALASALDLLPDLLSKRGIAHEVTRAIVEAFNDQKPIMEQLHERRSQ